MTKAEKQVIKNQIAIMKALWSNETKSRIQTELDIEMSTEITVEDIIEHYILKYPIREKDFKSDLEALIESKCQEQRGICFNRWKEKREVTNVPAVIGRSICYAPSPTNTPER